MIILFVQAYMLIGHFLARRAINRSLNGASSRAASTGALRILLYVQGITVRLQSMAPSKGGMNMGIVSLRDTPKKWNYVILKNQGQIVKYSVAVSSKTVCL